MSNKNKKSKANRKTKNNKQQLSYYTQIAIIAVFTFILYGNTIPNDYSFDDIYVTNNREVQDGFSAIPKLFVSLYGNMMEDGKPLKFGYRPIVKTSFAIEYGFFGRNPHISHFLNILFYLLTLFLLFKILQKLLRNYHYLLPLIITLLFAAHPAHTEVVSSLKNRDELFSFLGGIGTLYLFLLYFKNSKLKYAFAGLLVFIIGFLSKPTITTFIPLYPIVLYFFLKPKTGKVLFFLLGIAVVAYLANVVPRLYLDRPYRPVQFIENPLFYEDFWTKAATGMTIIWFYFTKLIFPHPLSVYYGFNMVPVVHWDEWKVWVSLIVHLALFVIALFQLKDKKLLGFGLLVYLISVGVFSNIFKIAMGIIADRFMYIPSLGFVIVLAWAIYKLAKTRPEDRNLQSKQINRIILMLVIVLIPYSGKTIIRNSQWDNQVTLLKADIDHLQNSAKTNFIYAGTMKGEIQKAMKAGITMNPKIMAGVQDIEYRLKLATDLYPDYYQAWDLWGSVYMSITKEYTKAIPYFEKAMEIKPDYIPGFVNRGLSYKKLGQINNAIADFKKAIELDPENLQANGNLYAIYKDLGEYDKAAFYGQKAKDASEKMKAKYGRKKK